MVGAIAAARGTGRVRFRIRVETRFYTIRRIHGSSPSFNGYKSIGSFHCDNVEDMMMDPDFQPPLLPFEAQPMSADFMLDRKKWTFLNHGAFGAALKCGHERAAQWREYLEQQPLRFFDRTLLPHLVHSARMFCKFTNADPRGLALISNVTAAINAAIAGYTRTFGESSQIVLWDTSYGSVKKMARAHCSNVVEIPLQSNYLAFLEDEDTILRALAEGLEKQADWRNSLLIIDHTTSNTALNMPIEKLAKFAKEAGMLVLVDGAHGLLAQKVDFQELPSVDIYVSNGHKWLCCPRGVAIIYSANKETRETILRRPAVLSHGLDDGYLSRFIWDGCRDYTAQLAAPVVLDFWMGADAESVRGWLKTKLIDGVRVIADKWHPMYANHLDCWGSNVTLAPIDLHSPMALVRLPSTVCGNEESPKDSRDAKQIQDFLYSKHIEVPVKCVNGILYARLSCHIYNELREFDRLADVMLDAS